MTQHKRRTAFVAIAALCSLLFPVIRRAGAAKQPAGAAASRAAQHPARRDDAAAAADFEAILPVLRHPRCMNCHSRGDFPRQGDDNHPHIMQVRRGPEGHGDAPVRCSTCHQDHNLPGLHTPPGAPDWGLPPPSMPMIWEGLTGRQLCELFKDPRQNGDRSVEQIVEHMHTPLVLWGWHPGEGRTPVAMAENEFLARVGDWAAKGAACPASAHMSANAR